MAAAALSIGLFAFWGVLGYAAVAIVHTGRQSCQRLLLAPTVGVVVVVLPTFWLNRAGIPVARFGPGLTIGLAVASLAVLGWRRPLTPLRAYLPFAVALLAAWLLVGRPMLTYGYDWMSYANDDMSNYSLLAFRVLTHGFYELPPAEALERGVDYSSFFWTYHVAGVRAGTDILLAWIASLTPLTVHQVFMPCIVAGHLVLLSAATALVYRSRRHRPAAILTIWLLAGSSLVTLATLYQLVAQVFGLALLCALACAVMPPAWSARPRRLLILGVYAGTLGAALFVVYPEVLPFFAVAAALYLMHAVGRGRLSVRSLAWVLAAAVPVGLAALNTHTPAALRFLVLQMQAGAGPAAGPTEAIFPDFLLPSGVAQLWGFQRIGGLAGEPWMSLSIAAGAALLVAVAVAAVKLAWRGEPAALFCAVMLAIAPGLFAGRLAFGLYKLALFIQPFMLATLVTWWLTVTPGRFRRVAPLLLVGLAGLGGQHAYVEESRGAGIMTAVPNASASRITTAFSRSLAAVAPSRLDLDTTSLVLAKLQALYLVGTPSTFLSRDFFVNVHRIGSARGYEPAAGVADAAAARLRAAVDSREVVRRFPVISATTEYHVFVAPTAMATAEDTVGGAVALTTGQQTIVNRRRLGVTSPEQILVKPYTEVTNHLVFIHSSLGQHYYANTDARRISLFQLEADPLYPGRTMSGLGRHFLFRVLRPSDSVRLGLDITEFFKGDGENRLPPASAIGAQPVAFPLVGRGSARVFSPAVTPRLIDGRPYVAIDMGVDGRPISVPRTGLMNAYSRDLAIDARSLVVYGRDISLVSEVEYRALRPPTRLVRFPEDLADPALEYSGLFEDGWLSERAWVELGRPGGARPLVIRGGPSPGVGGSRELAVLLDGREVGRRTVGGEEFVLRLDVPPGSGHSRVDLRVSRVDRLPPPDHRLVGIRLRSIEFEP